jgi:hypothetical protein
LKEKLESKCRLCKPYEENIDHITSGCPILGKSEYLMRHNKVCAHLHNSVHKTLRTERTDKWYTHTHMPKPVYEDVTVLCNQSVHTDTEVTANRPDIIIKSKERKDMHTDRCDNTRIQKCPVKGKGVKMQEFRYRDTTNVEPEMYDYTIYNLSHWNSDETLKEKS